MASFLLALDQGTSSSRAALFDRDGRMIAIAQQEYAAQFPGPGWVEQDPDAIWNSQIGAAKQVLEASGLTAAAVAAIGIANQRETTLLWERTSGIPVAPAIVWQDRRTADLCARLREDGCEPLFRERSGLPLDPYFSGTKIRWMLDNVDGLRARAERGEIAFGTVDTFLLWRLSGGRLHATDPSNASRTLLYNLHSGNWDPDLLAALEIPPAILPEVLPSSGYFGESQASLLGAPLPIAGVAGDQQAAAFGQACLRPGMAKNTYGTGSFLLMNTGQSPRISRNGLLTTVAWQREGSLTYALEGSIFVTGAAVQWLRDSLQILRTSDEIEPLAASVPHTGGVYFVPAFAGLGAPYWDPYARGAILGMTRATGRAEIARAVLEAACFQSHEVLEAMRTDGELELDELRVDGGMSRNSLLLQMQADILGVPVVRPAVTETTALGAAYLAGLAVGFWKDTDQIVAQWRADARFEPQKSANWRSERVAGWRKAVARTRHWEESSLP